MPHLSQVPSLVPIWATAWPVLTSTYLRKPVRPMLARRKWYGRNSSLYGSRCSRKQCTWGGGRAEQGHPGRGRGSLACFRDVGARKCLRRTRPARKSVLEENHQRRRRRRRRQQPSLLQGRIDRDRTLERPRWRMRPRVGRRACRRYSDPHAGSRAFLRSPLPRAMVSVLSCCRHRALNSLKQPNTGLQLAGAPDQAGWKTTAAFPSTSWNSSRNTPADKNRGRNEGASPARIPGLRLTAQPDRVDPGNVTRRSRPG